MKINGFEVGPHVIKEEGGKRHLIIDCRNAKYSPSISDDEACRSHVLRLLMENEADMVVLADVYERLYDEHQTKMLSELAALASKFESDAVWSYAHLGDPAVEGESRFGERHNVLVRVAHDLLLFDPIGAYLELIRAVRDEKARLESAEVKDSRKYFNSLLELKKEFESTELIAKVKELMLKLRQVPEPLGLYRSFFEVQVKPSFIGSRLMFDDSGKLDLLDEYSVGESSVQIFRHPLKTERMYFINPPEYSLSPEKYFVLT
ncbi:MAG: hypothetical protein HY917_02635 [Candidatus Diapherotrites archaeon]|nr:hypothetical protein [Candidatus Diapherotrites archaeon]